MWKTFFFFSKIGGIGKEHITKLLPWLANPQVERKGSLILTSLKHTYLLFKHTCLAVRINLLN